MSDAPFMQKTKTEMEILADLYVIYTDILQTVFWK